MNSLAIFDNQHPSFAPEKVDFSLFIFDNDLKAALPELFLVMSCLFLLLYGVIWSTSVERRYPLLLRNVNWLSLLVLGLTVVIAANNPISNGVFFYHLLGKSCHNLLQGYSSVGGLIIFINITGPLGEGISQRI